MSQLGKWFPCKPEDPSSDTQSLCKKQGVMANTCNTSTAEEETLGSLGYVDQPVLLN